MSDAEGADLSRRETIQSLLAVARFRPAVTAFLIGFSVFVALLEGVGLGFLIPIIDTAQTGGRPTGATGVTRAFLGFYDLLGVPFSLGSLIVGVGAVMLVRFTSSFLVDWLRVALKIRYVEHLQTATFESAMTAPVAYFDEEGSDEILNAVVTQAELAGKVIRDFAIVFQKLLLCAVYLGIAAWLSWQLTLFAAVFFGGLSYGIRSVVASGYAVGDRVAEANERIQETVQAGTQGIRDVKLYTMTEELLDDFAGHLDEYVTASITLGRNEAAIDNMYGLTTALTLFAVIYGAIEIAGLQLSSLGAFLFALFRLSPQLTQLNRRFYKFEGRLPHLVRTQAFVDRLRDDSRLPDGDRPVPEPLTPIRVEEVSFGYESEPVVRDASFTVRSGEFVALVGQSGAGKSTIASLLARLYDPDAGRITANGVAIDTVPIEAWRDRVAVVRQDPHVFDQTLRFNVTVGDRDASDRAVRRACEIARVTEFLDDLPEGLDTELGDDGVRLSGGQRQRVALARAVVKDADLLVLDEATSDLDTKIEREVYRNLAELDPELPIVVIAHRLSTVRDADQILTLADGRIVERGTHEELVDNAGAYRELYAASEADD